ncbi:MAG: SGNH/GDSL hydrolase family protein [Akkermansiaceae bacterium]
MFKTTLLFVTSLTLHLSLTAQADIMIQKGDKIAFLGDSITQAGARPGGYCNLIIEALNKKGLEVTPKYAGISGHKSNQMLARLEKDVLSHKPQWMTLSCGVNDVWHGQRGVKLEDYKKNITSIVDQAQAAGIKVIILTSTMIREDQANALNQKLKGYNDFLVQLSKEKKCLLADLNGLMQETIKTMEKNSKGNTVTSDGVHMNSAGNMMMAKGILKVMGFTAEELKVTEKAWANIPGTNQIRLNVKLSHAELEILEKEAKAQGKSIQQVFDETLQSKKAELLGK